MTTSYNLAIAQQLQERADAPDCPRHEADVNRAIADCLLAPRPIPTDLQDQYVKIVANQQGQDRYGN